MARMTLSKLVSEARLLYEDIKADKVKFAANFILRDLDEMRLAPVRGRASFSTKAPVEQTGNVTNGSNIIATILADVSYIGQKVQADGSLTWYTIEDVNQGIHYEVSSGYDGPTATGVVCRVVFDRYSLPKHYVGVKTLRREDKEPLSKVVDESTVFGRKVLQPSEPIHYYETVPLLDTEAIEIVLLNPPDTVYTYIINGTTKLTRFEEDSSQTDLPEEYEHCFVCGVFWLLTTFEEGVDISSYWKSWYFNLKKALQKTREPARGPSFKPLTTGPDLPIPLQERYSDDA